MLYYNTIDISKGIGPTKSSKSRECIICHYWIVNYGFKFQHYGLIQYQQSDILFTIWFLTKTLNYPCFN